MNTDMLLVFIVLGITTVCFMISKLRSDMVALFCLLSLVLLGIISIEEAMAGFSNSIVVMLAALFVVGAGIFRTGLAKWASQQLLKLAGQNENKMLLLMMLVVACLGAFLSNTGTVAVLLPIVVSLALQMNMSPSRFLIPLAFTSSMSGLLTLIATPANLIASNTLEKNGFEKLSFFSITPLGITSLVVGGIFMLTLGKRLLPNHVKGATYSQTDWQEKRAGIYYKLTGNLFTLKVPKGSKLNQQLLGDLRLPENYHLCVLYLERNKKDVLSLSSKVQLMAGPKEMILEEDLLYVQGLKEDVERFATEFALQLIEKEEKKAENPLVSPDLGIAEVVFTPNSALLNQTIRQTAFREKYNLNVLAVNRKGNYLLQELGSIKLKFGDALLVHGAWKDIEILEKEQENVVVVGQPQEEASMAKANGKAPIAAVVMLFMITLMALEIVPTVTASIIGASLMMITGCLRNIDDAYQQINWSTIFLIAAMLPVTTALEKTGGVSYIAESIVHISEGKGPMFMLVIFYLITNIFSQFISNTATAMLFAPVALGCAVSVGVSPYPFLLAVAVSANMAFATPVATPTNALVMPAGGYRFIDFVKIGVPLQIVMGIVMMLMIPLFFPF